MFAMSWRVVGTAQLSQRIRRMAVEMPLELGLALVQELEEVELPEVVARTPLRTGALRATEHVEGPEFKNGRISAQIVAGSDEVPYALIVHENLEAFHPVGQAKYIESVMNEAAPYITGRVVARMKQ